MHCRLRRKRKIEIKSCSFIKSAVKKEQYPHLDLPQIALVGRSNVGKSSLINTLVNRNNLAKISATPGKTRLINFFLVNEELVLVDLPGYGFARASKQEQRQWGPMIEEYLLSSPMLRHLFLLMDIRHTPTDDDRQMAYWTEHYAIDRTIIATKADKITKSKRKIKAGKLSDALGMTFRTPTIVFSAKDRTGRQEILDRMEFIMHNYDHN